MDTNLLLSVEFEGKTYKAEKGSNLRKALLEQGANLYNGKAQYINCRGLGSCGTCAIEVIEGKVNQTTKIEKIRKKIYPHTPNSPLRFACQITLEENLSIKKHSGFWGSDLSQ